MEDITDNGIGKTMALWYFLIRCIKDQRPVVWVSWNYASAYLFTKRRMLKHTVDDENALHEVISWLKRNGDWRNTVCLINSGRTSTNYPAAFDELGRFYVIASSPNAARLEQYHKSVHTYVMAPPSIEEVVALVYVTPFLNLPMQHSLTNLVLQIRNSSWR
jgi:hypothetical protein